MCKVVRWGTLIQKKGVPTLWILNLETAPSWCIWNICTGQYSFQNVVTIYDQESLILQTIPDLSGFFFLKVG